MTEGIEMIKHILGHILEIKQHVLYNCGILVCKNCGAGRIISNIKKDDSWDEINIFEQAISATRTNKTCEEIMLDNII